MDKVYKGVQVTVLPPSRRFKRVNCSKLLGNGGKVMENTILSRSVLEKERLERKLVKSLDFWNEVF